MYRKLQCVCCCKRCKASKYVVHQNNRVSFICIYIIYNKVYAYHWLASISIDWEQRKFEINVSMPRPFNTNLYNGTCRLLGYLFYLYSTKEMKIKAAVTIRQWKCSLKCPPPVSAGSVYLKCMYAKTGETTRGMGFWYFAAWQHSACASETSRQI